VERITAAVGSRDALLALIGQQWRRMVSVASIIPRTTSRLEIETALKRKIR
jgi:hypothetical protein